MRRKNVLAVTLVLEDNPDGLYAMEIMRRTRMLAGTLYPILAHLERKGDVEAHPESTGRYIYRRVIS